MDVDITGDMPAPTAQQPQQIETSKDMVPELSTKTGVKVRKVLCGGALKVRTPSPQSLQHVEICTLEAYCSGTYMSEHRV